MTTPVCHDPQGHVIPCVVVCDFTPCKVVPQTVPTLDSVGLCVLILIVSLVGVFSAWRLR